MKQFFVLSFFPAFSMYFFVTPFHYKSHSIKNGVSIILPIEKHKNTISSSGEKQIIEEKDTAELGDIHLFFKKYYLLSLLQNSNVSVLVKVDLINEHYTYNEIKVPNLHAGGLLNDFDFDFE